MKKIWIIGVMLAILLLATVSNAEELQGVIFECNYPVEEFSRGNVGQFVCMENGLMVLDTQNEYLSFQTFQEGTPKYRSSVIEDGGQKKCIWAIAEQEGTLLAVEAAFGEAEVRDYHEVSVYEIQGQAKGQLAQREIVQLQWFDLCEAGEEIDSAIALPSALILVTDKNRALRFDLWNGAGTVIGDGNCMEVLKMDNGNYLLVENVEEGIQFSSRDANSDAVISSRRITSNASGFATKGENAYYCDGYCLYQISLAEETEAEPVVNLSLEYGGKAMIYGERYLISAMDKLLAFDMNASAQKAVSVYTDSIDPSLLEAFARDNPDIQLVKENSRGQDAILTDLLTKDSTVDVYVLSTAVSPAFQTIRNRGYLREIGGEIIQEYVASLYPQIQSEVMADGKIYGVPISIQPQMSSIGVNMSAWKALGRTDAQLPQSWDAFMRFITEEWPAMREGAEASGICLMTQSNYESLLSVFIFNRESQQMERGEPVYSTPDMIHNYDCYRKGLQEVLYAPDSFMGRALFTVLTPELGTNIDSEYIPLPLSMDGQETYPVATMVIMLINPYSQRSDTAQKFIEYCTGHLSKLNSIQMMPGYNVPVESAYYQNEQIRLQEMTAEYDDKIAAAQSEVERRNLEAEKANSLQREMEAIEALHWEISEQSIQTYRERMRDFKIYYALNASDAENRKRMDLYEKFFSGKIDAATYASNLDQSITMSALEDQ